MRRMDRFTERFRFDRSALELSLRRLFVDRVGLDRLGSTCADVSARVTGSA